MTISNIVRQPAYSGVHRVKTNGGKDIIEQPVPAVLEPGLQEGVSWCPFSSTRSTRRPDPVTRPAE
jgi:hypothetical protein